MQAEVMNVIRDLTMVLAGESDLPLGPLISFTA